MTTILPANGLDRTVELEADEEEEKT